MNRVLRPDNFFPTCLSCETNLLVQVSTNKHAREFWCNMCEEPFLPDAWIGFFECTKLERNAYLWIDQAGYATDEIPNHSAVSMKEAVYRARRKISDTTRS